MFILLDNVPYPKNYFLNRNKIKTANGWTWLTVPVIFKGNSHKIIKEIEIDNRSDWRKKHWLSIYYSYKNSSYFDIYSDLFEHFYKQEWRYLAEASTHGLFSLLRMLNIKIPIKMASALGVEGRKEELILNICKSVQAEEYLSGRDGRNYLNLGLWQENKLKVEFYDYQHPQYRQLHGEFLPQMSVIDLLFNGGPDSLTILKN